jgi:excisionase family DNA binding protein
MTIEAIEKLLGPKEVGEILNLRRSKIHQMIAGGEIPSVIVAQGPRRRVFRVKPSELAKWMKQREVGSL